MQTKIATSQNVYTQLIKKAQLDLEQPKNLVTHLHSKLLLIYNILAAWSEYTRVMKMSYENIRQMQKGSINEGMAGEESSADDSKRLEEAIQAKKKELQTGNDQDITVESFISKIQQEMSDAAHYNAITSKVRSSTESKEMPTKEILEELEKDFDRVKEKGDSIYGTGDKQSSRGATGNTFFSSGIKGEEKENRFESLEFLNTLIGVEFKTVI